MYGVLEESAVIRENDAQVSAYGWEMRSVRPPLEDCTCVATPHGLHILANLWVFAKSDLDSVITTHLGDREIHLV